jgi:antibiotic biosynthesis monooxygenase (ABM) superfamily enzyme
VITPLYSYMPIHVAITRKVLPGKEAEFTDALRRFLGESFLHGGVQGAGMITALPGSDSREIGILRTFADEAERDAFYNSQLFRDWEEYASTLTEQPNYRQLTGLEAWFRSPTPPPKWKMAIATLCGVYPTSLFLSFVLRPLLHSFPPAITTLIISASMVGILTWIVMPQVTRILKPWLIKT